MPDSPFEIGLTTKYSSKPEVCIRACKQVTKKNRIKYLGPNRWYEENVGTRSIFHPDNIIISFRKVNVVAIIERSSGHIVWRLGPYFKENPGDEHKRILQHNVPPPLDQISGQHNPHIIPKGLLGAGNILLFDCQGGAGYPPASLEKYSGSRILEINPITKEIVRQYTAEDSGLPPWTFFSSFVSNAQRLPNSNTLITEGMQGRLFQVTAERRVAWEYYSPSIGYGATGTPALRELHVQEADRVTTTPLVDRSQAVPDDWIPDNVEKVVVETVRAKKSSNIASVSPNEGTNANSLEITVGYDLKRSSNKRDDAMIFHLSTKTMDGRQIPGVLQEESLLLCVEGYPW
jgi:arylsulfotransferase ASST